MPNTTIQATAKGMSKISARDVMVKAWADYRRDAFRGLGVRRGGPFNRGHFAYCLRMAWAVAKEAAARAAAKPVAVVAKVCINPARAEAIRAELFDMQMGDFVNWTRHSALGAELAGLEA